MAKRLKIITYGHWEPRSPTLTFRSTERDRQNTTQGKYYEKDNFPMHEQMPLFTPLNLFSAQVTAYSTIPKYFTQLQMDEWAKKDSNGYAIKITNTTNIC